MVAKRVPQAGGTESWRAMAAAFSHERHGPAGPGDKNGSLPLSRTSGLRARPVVRTGVPARHSRAGGPTKAGRQLGG